MSDKVIAPVAGIVAAGKEHALPPGGGEMGELIRSFDWSTTPLGPAATWSQSLQTAVGIMLSSRYAMFVWWGRELTNLYNDAYRPFLGKKHPRSLGRSARDVWGEIWELIGPRTEAVFERGESTFDEALLLLMDRFGYPEETYFTFSYSPIHDDGGKIGGLFCAVTDETRRVIGERRLRLLREVASSSSETHTPEQVCATAAACISRSARDLPFVLLYLTEPDGKAARLVAQAGIERASPGAPLVIEFAYAAAVWPLAQAAATNELITIEDISARIERLPTGAWDRPPQRAAVVPLRERDQTAVSGYLVAGLNPYLDFDEEYRGFIGLLSGQISAAVASARAYQDERRRAEALAEIDRAKTAFFSNVSHEFRTPLTLMLGPLEQALEAPAQSLPQRRDDLLVAHRSGLRLLRLVNTLLDFSRIEAGRMQASYEPVDLASFTSGLAGEFHTATERAGLQLSVDCEELAEPVWVDCGMWEKIVLNLLSNALKFTFAGAITVRLRGDAGHAVLSVADTGIGIPADELPRIFERFHRVEGQHGRTHEGTGIGLALVQELSRLHGGSVEAASEVGAGSTFTVRIPFGSAHLPADRLKPARSERSTTRGAQPYVEEALRWLPHSPATAANDAAPAADWPAAALVDNDALPTVLIADDNADMREYVARLLEPHYHVATATDGVDALAALRKRRPDLLLSDVMMPRLDGLGLVRQVRTDPALADIPIVLLSARAGEEASVEGLDVGADDYLVKPFSSRELLARVGANLKMAQLRHDFEVRMAADLQAMTVLRELGVQCGRTDADPAHCLQEIVNAAMTLGGGDKGSLQLIDPNTGAVSLAAQRGFDQPPADLFAQLGDPASACTAALRSGEQVIVDEVARSRMFCRQASEKTMARAGVRALISTPLLGSKGQLLGILSTHFSKPHRPNERELHLLTLLARQAVDYLERKRAGEVEQILIRELQHRSNNLLSVMQAIVQGSLANGHSVAGARTAVEARLQALARANRRITQSNYSDTGLDEIVRLELRPFGERVSIAGPAVMIGPKHAQNIALALHELATNAAKYGAFSADHGKVAVSWAVVTNGTNNVLKLEWRESGGPPAVVPTREGFGTKLLKAVCADVQLRFAPTGLRCEIAIPLASNDIAPASALLGRQSSERSAALPPA